MDLGRWSRTPLQDHVLDPAKQPFTFSFASQFFPVRELTTRNKMVFDKALHCGASVKAVSFRNENYFVANAGVGGNMALVSPSGVAGVGLVGLGQQKFDFIRFVRTVLSEHWYKDVAGCERWLFIPKGFVPESEQQRKRLQHRHGDHYEEEGGKYSEAYDEDGEYLVRNVSTIPGGGGSGAAPSYSYGGSGSGLASFRKYFIAKEAHGIPMFPINGACLYPSTEMELNIFEPRYRAMVKQCIENREVFGFIPRDDANNKFVDAIGTIAYIKEVVSMKASGECHIVIEGLRRFRLKRGASLRIQPGSFGLGFANIQFYDDVMEDGDEAEREELEQFSSLEHGGFGSEKDMLYRRAQAFLGGGDQAQSAHDMSFQLAQASCAPQRLKIRWLKSVSTQDRLSETIEFFDSIPREA
mmetsp:Transcript_2867/g.6898  ORF Transcript_2867/g.6898 Transcript_2867/m.6898 type:complete len:412 (+) Transcript_2867:2-1237(+)